MGYMGADVVAGIVGAVVLPLVGCSVGVGQIVRGAWNTPEAVSETSKGDKRWDMRKREWVVDNLDEDALNLGRFARGCPHLSQIHRATQYRAHNVHIRAAAYSPNNFCTRSSSPYTSRVNHLVLSAVSES